MQKPVQKFKILFLAILGLLLTSCEKTDTATIKKPLPPTSGLSVYNDPLSYLNSIRTYSNLNSLKSNKNLNLAALNHAKYTVINESKAHEEIPGMPDFTGVTPSQRAYEAGYFSNVLENISIDAKDYYSAIDGLMSAIYHRFSFLDPTIDEIGFNKFEKNENSSFVFKMGNSGLNDFCTKNVDDTGNGKFYMGMCKNIKLKIRSNNLDSIKQLNQTPYVYYPNNENTKAVFSAEIPDPIPECKITANPISIEFSKYDIAVSMIDFKIYKDQTELTNTKILTESNDPNKRLNKYQFALFNKDVFEFNTEYTAQFQYMQDGHKKNITWNFKTKTPKNQYFIAQDGDVLGILPDIYYDIFIKPKDCNDLIKDYKYTYKGMQKPEISTADANTITIKANGRKNAKMILTTQDGRKITLILLQKSMNAPSFGGSNYIIIVLLTVLLIFYFIRKRKSDAKNVGR